MFRKAQKPKAWHLLLAVVCTAPPVCAQAPVQATGAVNDESSRMLTPTPVSGEGYSAEFASETPRTNYLSGGLSFTTNYDDNIASTGSAPISDVSYSIRPSLSLDQSRSRLSWNLSYSPGFTFYQKNTTLNQADHNANLAFQYRLSPHVTFTVHDIFRKTSDALSQSGPSSTNSGVGGVLNSPPTVIAPITDQISNNGDVGITYQFAANAMVGASGIFSLLQYPDLARTPGLFNSNTRGGQGFYTFRISGRHYVGANYVYQDLRSTPNGAETESHSLLLFYTFYLKPTLSLSAFGGPEHTDTTPPGGGSVHQWSPAVGASLGWQGEHTSMAASVSHSVAAGAGLSSAAKSDAGDLSLRRKLSPHFTAVIRGSYSQNKTLDTLSTLGTEGHSVTGTGSIETVLSSHLGLEIGYTRLHQNYANIAAIGSALDRDRVWVSLTYQFRRPLGR